MLKRAAKSIASLILGRYRLVRIYRADLRTLPRDQTVSYELRDLAGSNEMLQAFDATIREHAWFAEGDAHAFGLWDCGTLTCSCVVWDGRRFADPAVRPLGDKEAALVDIVTAEGCRQRGFALATIQYAMAQMERRGYRSMVCTIWHNNKASIRAFEKAGWRYVAFAVEIFPFGRRLTLRFAKPEV